MCFVFGYKVEGFHLGLRVELLTDVITDRKILQLPNLFMGKLRKYLMFSDQ